MNRLAIAVLTNGRDYLEQTLWDLHLTELEPEWQKDITVINNDIMARAAIGALASKGLIDRVLHNAYNIGIAAGWNQAWGLVNAINTFEGVGAPDAIALVQDDVRLEPDWFQQCWAALEHWLDVLVVSGYNSPYHKTVGTRDAGSLRLYLKETLPGVHLVARPDFWENVFPVDVREHHTGEDWWFTRYAPGAPANLGKLCGVVPGLVDHVGRVSTWNPQPIREYVNQLTEDTGALIKDPVACPVPPPRPVQSAPPPEAPYSAPEETRILRQIRLVQCGCPPVSSTLTARLEDVAPAPLAPAERELLAWLDHTEAPQRSIMASPALSRILLVADVRGWAFDVNLRDLARYLEKQFRFDFWYVGDYIADPRCLPDFTQFDGVFAPFHRWSLDGVLPWGKMLGSCRSDWFFVEDQQPFSEREWNLVNRYKAFHLVTRHCYDGVKDHCPGAVYLTNPVDMDRVKPVAVTDRLVASWNGNAQHGWQDGLDTKGFYRYVVAGCQMAGVPLEYAEYYTKRLTQAEMPDFYTKANVAVCASMYEGASNSCMEGMAAGQALITTDVGNHREIQKSELENFGESGIMFVDRDPKAFAATLTELKGDMGRVQAMGVINRLEMEARWSWAAWADRYAEFLRSVL